MLGNVYTYGSVAFALARLAAVLGRLADAEAHFETALTANRRIRAAVWLGHTQCELADLLLTRGQDRDTARANELIASARQTGDALGLVRLRRKLELLDGPIGSARADALSLGGARIQPEDAALDKVAASALSQTRDVRALASLDGTVTIMFSDIVESTVLYEQLGDWRGSEVIRTHNEIFRREVAAYRGMRSTPSATVS